MDQDNSATGERQRKRVANQDKVKAWRKRTKEIIVKALGRECVICGYSTCVDAMALHHLDPSKKDATVSSMMANPTSLLVIKEEAKKCVLLCVRCHSEVHAGVNSIPEGCAKFNEALFWSLVPPLGDCPVCSGPVTFFSRKYCSQKCAGEARATRLANGPANQAGGAIKRRKYPRPPKDELERMVLSMPIVRVGDFYGVASDNTIRKWCRYYALDTREVSPYSRRNRKAPGLRNARS